MFIPTSQNPAYFITIDAYRKTKIFLQDDLFKIINDSLNYCEKQYGIKILNYVLMPDHLHFIFYFINNKQKIFNKKAMGLRGKYSFITTQEIDIFITNFKKFTAHEIIKKLKLERSKLLSRLILKKEKKNKHWYSLWLDDKFTVVINNLKVLKEKQKYILNNPIKAKLVDNIENYKYIKY